MTLILLDIRAEEEYKAAHIDGAICIPLSELKNQSALDELNKSKKIVVYGESGEDSAEACEILVQNEFKAYNMLGGLKAWQQNGFPVSASSTSSTSSTSTSGFEALLAFAAFAFALLFGGKSGRGGRGGKGGKNSKNK